VGHRSSKHGGERIFKPTLIIAIEAKLGSSTFSFGSFAQSLLIILGIEVAEQRFFKAARPSSLFFCTAFHQSNGANRLRVWPIPNEFFMKSRGFEDTAFHEESQILSQKSRETSAKARLEVQSRIHWEMAVAWRPYSWVENASIPAMGDWPDEWPGHGDCELGDIRSICDFSNLVRLSLVIVWMR